MRHESLSTRSHQGATRSPTTGEIPLAPIQAAYERSGIPLSEIARRLGWNKPDNGRVGRVLGYYRINGRRQQMITYSMAVRLCEAIGIDPVDGGC